MLNALAIRNAKPGRYADGKGLYLLVGPSGSKSWVLRVQVDGKRRDYGLGSLDQVSLSDARDKAHEWRKVAKEGRNPSVEQKRQRSKQKTFEEAAKLFHEERKGDWKNPKHRDQFINTLTTYAFPTIGKLGVDSIDAAEIQEVLLPIWKDKAETARRVRQRIATVLDYSKAMGWRDTEAPMRAVNTLLRGLKQPPKGNFAAMPYADLPQFMTKLEEGSETVGRLALQFAILNASRSGEVRGAKWGEIDLGTKVWSIPGDRMKGGKDHVVPLSRAAIRILGKAKSHSDGEPSSLVFPGQKLQPLSDMTLSKVLKDNGGDGYTVHGFRSSFRDWCADNGISNDWAEAALAHSLPNKVEAAYRRTTFLEQRRVVMDTWAGFNGL